MLEIIILIPLIIIGFIFFSIFFEWWQDFLWKVFNWKEYSSIKKENKRIKEHNNKAAYHNSKVFLEMKKILDDPFASEIEKDKIRKEIKRYLDSLPEEY